MLRKRVVTAIWSLLLLFAAVWFDGPLPWFTILVALCGGLAVFEFYRITGVDGSRPLQLFGLVGTLALIVHPHFATAYTVPLLLTAMVALSMAMLVFLPSRDRNFISWAWMLTGAIYVGWLLSCLVSLRLEGGIGWVLLPLLVTFGSDTLAFFIGRAFGRHKLAPRISPGKTWEGACGGIAGAVLVSLLFTLPTPLRLPVTYGHLVPLSILISILGQIGDLAESLLKRSSGVKESGSLMPGHGGLLDRADSIVFAAVTVWWYYALFVAG